MAKQPPLLPPSSGFKLLPPPWVKSTPPPIMGPVAPSPKPSPQPVMGPVAPKRTGIQKIEDVRQKIEDAVEKRKREQEVKQEITESLISTPVVDTRTVDTGKTFVLPSDAHPPGAVIPGMGGTIGVTPITPTEPLPAPAPSTSVDTGTSTVDKLIGGGGTIQKTIQTPGGSIQTTTIGGETTITGGTSVGGPSGRVVGGSYEAGGGTGGGRTYAGPVRETPIVRDYGYGVMIQEAETYTKFGYNPYQQDTAQTRAYDTALSNLEKQLTSTTTGAKNLQTGLETINQSMKQIQDSPSDSTWTIKYYDDKIGKEITLKDLSQKEAVRFYEQQRTKTEQNLRDYANQANELKKNMAVIGGYKESRYTINETDEGYSFGLPKASDVYVAKHGRGLSGIALSTAAFLESPLAISTLFSAGQQALTGDKKVGETRLEELSAYALGLDESIAKGEYFQKVVTSPAMIEGVYMPIVMMGGGALISEGAGLAKAGLTGLTGKITTYVAPITEKLAPFASKISAEVKYIGFRGGFAGKTLGYETGEILAAPGRLTYDVLTEGAVIARRGITGLASRLPEMPSLAGAGEQLQYLGYRTGFAGKTLLYETGEALSTPGRLMVEYIGVPSAKKAIVKYGMFSLMEGPELVKTAQEHPERVGGMLGSSLFSWELGWGAMELGAKIGIPSGEQAYYKYGKGQPTPTDIYFKDTGRTTFMDIKEPYPQARILSEKTPGTVTIIEEYPKRGRLELYEAERPKGGLEIPASYEQEVTRVGKGAKTLDIIEAQPGLTKGELLIEEPGKGRLTITEFTPTAETKYDLGLGTRTGLATPTSTLPYPGEGSQLFETMPGTKTQALQYQAERLKPYDIGMRPKEGWSKELFGEQRKTVPGELSLKEDIISIPKEYKTKYEPKIETMDVGRKAEENLFYKELSEGKPSGFDVDIGRIGVAEKETVGVRIKGKTKVFTGEQLRGLGKGELKARPQIYTRQQLEKALYKPGGMQEVLGKQGRLQYRIIEEKPVRPGVRPEKGWGEYLGERQEARIVIEKPKTYALPELEKEILGGKAVTKKTPLRFQKTTEPGITTKAGDEIRSVTGKDMDLITIKKTEAPVTKEGFKPSGTYESPDITYFTMDRPLTRQEYRILRDIGDFDRTTGRISRYWEGTKPGVKTTDKLQEGTLHGLLSSREGEDKLIQPTLLGLGELTGLETITVPRAEQQIKTTYGGDLIQRTKDELGFKQGQEPGLLTGTIPVSLTGSREDVRQLQATESLQEQQQKQELKKGLLQEPFTETIIEPIRETRLRLKPPRPPEEKTPKIIIPRFEPPKKPQAEEPSRDILGEGKPGEAYDVYVKERSMYAGKIRKPTRFTRVNKQPVSYSDALSLGGEITDNTSAISFRLKKTRGPPQRLDRPIQDYASRAHKFTRRGDTIIEKAEYRMDTPGEIKGISSLGWGKRKRNGKTNGGLLTNISSGSGLPRNKTNGLFSTRNKLKENFLFRKKKNGGKKNAYF